MKNRSTPLWFQLGNELLWPIMDLTLNKTDQRKGPDVSVNHIPACAAIHLVHCLDASYEANKKGRHALAISLVRQCVESLTIIEFGLHDPNFGDPLLKAWWNGRKTQGQLRMALEATAWSNYGDGLWNESWSEYFGEFAKAVQDYAHYSQRLLGWQMVVPEGEKLQRMDDGHLQARMSYGFKSYDKNKATRITMLHILLGWTTARIIIATGGDPKLDLMSIKKLGIYIANSQILGLGRLEWHQNFWPNEFEGIAE